MVMILKQLNKPRSTSSRLILKPSLRHKLRLKLRRRLRCKHRLVLLKLLRMHKLQLRFRLNKLNRQLQMLLLELMSKPRLLPVLKLPLVLKHRLKHKLRPRQRHKPRLKPKLKPKLKHRLKLRSQPNQERRPRSLTPQTLTKPLQLPPLLLS